MTDAWYDMNLATFQRQLNLLYIGLHNQNGRYEWLDQTPFT